MSPTNETIALAAEVARRLDYTTEDLEEFCSREGNERLAAALGNKDFYATLDLIEFKCACCEWWKPQIENATPDGGEWICQECIKGWGMKVIHSVIHASFGQNSRTRCGIVACTTNATTDLKVYTMLCENGNTIGATTRNSAITCKKCLRSKQSMAQLPEELRDAR